MRVFIVNSVAGNGKGRKVWPVLEKKLKEEGEPYEVNFTEYPGHATELASRASRREDVRVVVGVGGDGTVHEVAAGLVGTRVPLGYIPAGSGNDFARAQKIPSDPLAALDRIVRQEPSIVDTARINEERMVSTAGIGFDGSVARAVNRSPLKKWLKGFTYVLELVRLLFTYQPRNVTMILDNQIHTFQDVWLIAVANIPFYGGGMKICPQASNRDGILDLCVVRGISRWELLVVFPKVFRGTHVHHPAVSMMKGSHLEIRSDFPMVIHADGEIIGETPVRIEIQPESLHTV
ncbi:YegS/Rv2252/BmrU family lipid kinase [Melghirimyces profundicolus]|uniref:YegS/Rv2252/BmrU family lipid kinase n=1 Tax=Melghirimyces profundicolus TaxID=1242148 RepID=A0A2T6C273_9BACL|nr:diacylglycerol kinase family protein [Melghirimyces profundicolus]PTX62421.1 YegS/Rv2252/BmrU family lipid kinase [Melghirimyces profundicolus]